MTLREKIGQLLVIGFRGAEPAECDVIVRAIREQRIGGVILFDEEMVDRSRGRRNIVSPAQVKALVAHLQAQAATPLLVAIDQEGGRVNRLKPKYGFPDTPSHAELGRRNEPAETRRQAEQIAATLAELGINWNLAPVVDVDANAQSTIISGKARSFSRDPEVVAAHASEFVRGHRARGVLTCAKHFPGHGSAAGDTHLGLVDVTPTWTEAELIPFERLMAAGLCDAVMTAHVFNAKLDPERPATLSRDVLTGLLRGRLGFTGVITSDDMEMKAIASHYGLESALPHAIDAGLDVLCFGNNGSYDPDIAARAVDILARAVESGRLTEARIDESCARVLALKRQAKLIP